MSSYYVHPLAICDSESIGHGTRIEAFARVLPGARIGADCNLCDGVFVETDVTIDDRVTVKRGVKIGKSSMVGAGSVVTSDVPAHAIVRGTPARIVGYVDTHLTALLPAEQLDWSSGEHEFGLAAAGVRPLHLPTFTDLRGSVSVAELAELVPFDLRRVFFVFDVPGSEVRGEHAHRLCHQLLVAVHGSCSVVVDDGSHQAEVTLDSPSLSLHIPPMIWAVQYRHSPDAVLLVLASHSYDPDDYIRDYDEFLRLVGR